MSKVIGTQKIYVSIGAVGRPSARKHMVKCYPLRLEVGRNSVEVTCLRFDRDKRLIVLHHYLSSYRYLTRHINTRNILWRPIGQAPF